MGPFDELFEWSIGWFLEEPDRVIAPALTGCGVLVVWIVIWWRTWGIRKERDVAREERAELQKKTDDLKNRLINTQEELRQSEAGRNELSDAKDGLDDRVQELTETNSKLEESLAELKSRHDDLEARLAKMDAFDGRLWETAPTATPPMFVPLRERRCPIISLANLKGGVGKTTLTANLGATLAAQGARVLMLDLDFQGSLTSLCLPGDLIVEVRERRRLVDCLLPQCNGDVVETEDCLTRVPSQDGAWIAPADERLFEVEMRALVGWLRGETDGDVRFGLRERLHAVGIRERFDFILIDCPPRLTTASINGLAASDFVLIPTIPDEVSCEAVPRLLNTLSNLKRASCPHLSILGVLANKFSKYRDGMINVETQTWSNLQDRCTSAWGSHVYLFESKIARSRQFAEASGKDKFAALIDSNVKAMFQKLLAELKERMPDHASLGS